MDETKEVKMEKDRPYDCLWDATHEHMQEWYDNIKKCIEKY